MVLGGKKSCLFSIGNGAEIQPLREGQKIPCKLLEDPIQVII